MTMAFLMPAALMAAGPAAKIDPVAEGFPDWRGVSEKGYVSGREICASDLRHRVTVVIELEPNEKLTEQLLMATPLVCNGASSAGTFGVNWMTFELPRDSIVLVSYRGSGGKREHAMFLDAVKPKGRDANTLQSLAVAYAGTMCSVYDNVTFSGAPDGTGKRPFAYVMGPEGKEPLYQGTVTKDSIKDATAVILKAKRQIATREDKWKPYSGYIQEPKFFPQLAKALEKGRSGKVAPLDPVAKAILKDVTSADAERAREAQVLFDAINQTRGDLELRIRLEAGEYPQCAYYDIQEMLKYWPMSKKRMDAVLARLRSNPEIEPIAKMYCKLVVWGNPDFTPRNAAEAKKIVQELNKMKKALGPVKESSNIQTQNAALLVDTKVDEVLALVSGKTSGK